MKLLTWGRVALHVAAVLVTGRWGTVARAVDAALAEQDAAHTPANAAPPSGSNIPDNPSTGG